MNRAISVVCRRGTITNPGSNSLDKDKLCSIVERIQYIESQKGELSGDIKEIYAEAKSLGFSTAVIRKCVRLLAKSQSERLRRHFPTIVMLEPKTSCRREVSKARERLSRRRDSSNARERLPKKSPLRDRSQRAKADKKGAARSCMIRAILTPVGDFIVLSCEHDPRCLQENGFASYMSVQWNSPRSCQPNCGEGLLLTQQLRPSSASGSIRREPSDAATPARKRRHS